ncbi:AraC family transcriptional activator of pobA [Pedobacter sp. W3I1]|uniref:helix-turn-helix domain-containing protein n=1 Tax=Pedobacter sp. W3I1 TaxID=3042291 RepID=UPI0027841BD5|nr:response regulator transcription factor [Pedobacter sp. W3I1]MDQ0640305.1 AraC family transcriptional activator of pobA [Pedobacter sp. W3I1]
MKQESLEHFYRSAASVLDKSNEALLPKGINREIGHFNIFNLGEFVTRFKDNPSQMPYNRRGYYKVSLVTGRNRLEYADKVAMIDAHALVFATPRIPYHWVPLDEDQNGFFCIFTKEFLLQSKSGVVLDDLPLFKPGGYPVFDLTELQSTQLSDIFQKILEEIESNYLYKYDLIRNYLLELIHFGQKLQPITTYNHAHDAAARVSSLFIELLERQFPIDSQNQRLSLRSAQDFADRLSIHANHLNKLLKESTGKTTTQHIFGRIAQEAKILLKQTDWNIAEIAFSLGFEQPSHFSTFFKKLTSMTPIELRSDVRYSS